MLKTIPKAPATVNTLFEGLGVNQMVFYAYLATKKYLVEALRGTNGDPCDFLTQISNTFSAPAEENATFAHSLGVDIGGIRSRFRRKALEDYTQGVMINESLRGRRYPPP